MFRRAGLLSLLVTAVSSAALLRIELSERSDVLGGRSFGAAGAYERLVGKAYFAADPNLAANRIVADIGLAPRNDKGLVEFSADLYVLRPRDPGKGNGAVLYEVSNRGGKGMLSTFNRAEGSSDPTSEKAFGDGLLLEQGYTLVWLGWQFDVPPKPKLMRLYTPAVPGVTGVVRAEIIVNSRQTSHSVSDRNHVPYPVVNPGDPQLTLTVRDRVLGPRTAVPRAAWHIENGTQVVMRDGFEPGRIYELVYTARNPPLVGLGPAAIRDLISFLKYGGNDLTPLGDMRRAIKRAYGYGVSQSGRFLRTFLYYGFNRDEKGRRVFDGMIAHVAGGGRGSFNHRFAQPSRDGGAWLNTLYPTDIFPFADQAQTDPETGLTDGLLSHATPPEAAPKIFYTNSSYEYYGRAASLIHTTLDGRRDAPVPPNVRIYLFAGSQHGPAGFPVKAGAARYLPNPNPFPYSLRALLGALDRWVRDGTEPPPSRYPRIDAGEAVPLEAVRFPKLPGVAFPARIHQAYRVDYGPQFRDAGIVTIEPPKVGKPFPILVPQVDADGNETSGVRLPDVAVPLATLAGWNLRTPAIGAADELYSLTGSWFPFAATKAERIRTGDPRPSIEERYRSQEDYLERVEKCARELVRAGFLLERDVPRFRERGESQWKLLTKR